jgi:hypothetical protein
VNINVGFAVGGLPNPNYIYNMTGQPPGLTINNAGTIGGAPTTLNASGGNITISITDYSSPA